MGKRTHKKSAPIFISIFLILAAAICAGTYWYYNFGPGDTTCIITYNIDGESTSYEYEKGTNVTVPSVEVKEGYRFVGFEPELTTETVAKKDQTYTAKYVKTHQITFDINGEISYQTYDEGTLISEILSNIEVEVPERYSFSHWVIDSTSGDVLTHDVTVTAVFVKSEVVVAFYDKLTSERLTEDLIVPINYTFETLPFEVPEGYVYEIYNSNNATWEDFSQARMTKDQKLYVIMGTNIYTVIFYYGNNQNLSMRVPEGYSFNVESLTTQMNNKTDYTLIGFKNKTTGEAIDLENLQVSSTLLIEAIYGPNQCKVNYFVDSVQENSEYINLFGNPTGYTPTDIPSGYQFAGWSTSADGEVVDLSNLSLTDHINLYAIFTPEVYTIMVIDNEGNQLAVKELEFGYKIYSATAVFGISYTKDGYTHLNDTIDGVIVSYPYTITGPVTITVNFQANSYKVDYYANGSGSTYVSTPTLFHSETVVSGTVLTEPSISAPEKTGYTFIGWGLNKYGSVMADFETGLTITNQTNLYTIYEANKYTVTFIVKGETIDTQTVTTDNCPTEPTVTNLVGKEQISYWTVAGERVDNISSYKISADTVFEAFVIEDPEITYTDPNLIVKLGSSEGEVITSGSKVESGSWIHIELTPDENYTGNFIKVNGLYVGSGQLYPVTNENLVIETEYLNTRTETTGVSVIVSKSLLGSNTDQERLITQNSSIYEPETPHTFTINSLILNDIAAGTTYTYRDINNQTFIGSVSFTLEDGTIMFIQVYSTARAVVYESDKVTVRVYTSNPSTYTFNYVGLKNVLSNYVA